jgi:hypothetical protein
MGTDCIGPNPRAAEEIRSHLTPRNLEPLLADAEIETICRQFGRTWRRRLFTPAVTVRAMIHRGLHPDKSIAAVLTELAATLRGTLVAPTPSAFCQARARLPRRLWRRLLDRSVERLVSLAGRRHLVFGRPLYLFDGSSVSMPDEPALVRTFGRTRTRHGPSRFPVARLAVLVLAGVEAIVDYRLARYRTAEDTLFHQIWHLIPDGSICLYDRALCSFYNFAKLAARGVDVLTRLHQRRDAERLIRDGRRIGPGQWSVSLRLARQLRRRYADPALPQALTVRLIRVRFRRGGCRRSLWLVTTLRDPNRYPRHQLIALYRRRWGIETRIGSLKTTLKLNVLRSKTPASVRSEVAATILAHNLVWTLIHQAVTGTRIPADRVSFIGAARTIVAFGRRLLETSGLEHVGLYARMLHFILYQTNPHRPNRVEPRLIKREPVRFAYLRIPRDEARRKCLT